MPDIGVTLDKFARDTLSPEVYNTVVEPLIGVMCQIIEHVDKFRLVPRHELLGQHLLRYYTRIRAPLQPQQQLIVRGNAFSSSRIFANVRFQASSRVVEKTRQVEILLPAATANIEAFRNSNWNRFYRNGEVWFVTDSEETLNTYLFPLLYFDNEGFVSPRSRITIYRNITVSDGEDSAAKLMGYSVSRPSDKFTKPLFCETTKDEYIPNPGIPAAIEGKLRDGLIRLAKTANDAGLIFPENVWGDLRYDKNGNVYLSQDPFIEIVDAGKFAKVAPNSWVGKSNPVSFDFSLLQGKHTYFVEEGENSFARGMELFVRALDSLQGGSFYKDVTSVFVKFHEFALEEGDNYVMKLMESKEGGQVIFAIFRYYYERLKDTKSMEVFAREVLPIVLRDYFTPNGYLVKKWSVQKVVEKVVKIIDEAPRAAKSAELQQYWKHNKPGYAKVLNLDPYREGILGQVAAQIEKDPGLKEYFEKLGPEEREENLKSAMPLYLKDPSDPPGFAEAFKTKLAQDALKTGGQAPSGELKGSYLERDDLKGLLKFTKK